LRGRFASVWSEIYNEFAALDVGAEKGERNCLKLSFFLKWLPDQGSNLGPAD